MDALELRIPAGSFFGLLGPNGAGKTTLIGSVAGLVRAPTGRVFVFGHDAVADARARLLLGLAPQEVHLDRFLTAREVLVYHGRYFGMRKLDAEERADELLEVFVFAGPCWGAARDEGARDRQGDQDWWTAPTTFELPRT